MTAEQRSAYQKRYIAAVKKRRRDVHTGKKTCCGLCFAKANREWMADYRAAYYRRAAYKAALVTGL